MISYTELLEVFWNSHFPLGPAWKRQYMSAIFYHDPEQLRLAEDSKKRQETLLQQKIFTELLPATTFYRAEDYHQKYRLRADAALLSELQAFYPEWQDAVDSTVAARLNAYLAGYGSPSLFARERDKLGLSPSALRRLHKMVERRSQQRER